MLCSLTLVREVSKITALKQLKEKEISAKETLPPGIVIESYQRENIQPGIVHFGVGNFHRCHQAKYVDNLLSQNHFQWGIIGVSMQSSAAKDKLAPQDYLYTEVTLSHTTEIKIIRSILNILVAQENQSEVVRQVSDPRIKLVTTTITEKGYYLSNGQLNKSSPQVISDITSLSRPSTIYGFLAASVIQRRQYDSGPLSVVCCDNIQGGGNCLHAGVEALLDIHDRDSLAWSREHVSFASSMVDRVTPVTDSNLRQLVASKLNLEDAWPVSAEPFSQWVIENKFAAERPPLDLVGVVFSDDISAYEQMKLRFLNAGHSIVSVLGYLMNKEHVHEALQQPAIFEFLRQTLLNVVLPTTKTPASFCGEKYIEEVLKRFQNNALPYKVHQVNTDSSQKIQQRWFPAIDAALESEIDTKYMTFLIAAWAVHIEKALNEKQLNDPLKTEFSAALIDNSQENTPDTDDRGKIYNLLKIAGAEHFRFFMLDEFMESAIDYYQKLQATDLNQILTHLVTQRSLD